MFTEFVCKISWLGASTDTDRKYLESELYSVLQKTDKLHQNEMVAVNHKNLCCPLSRTLHRVFCVYNRNWNCREPVSVVNRFCVQRILALLKIF